MADENNKEGKKGLAGFLDEAQEKAKALKERALEEAKALKEP